MTQAIDHKSRSHALLSASGASRWLACPPSARIEEKFPDTESDFAKEGTIAHEICELFVRHRLGLITKRKRDAGVKKWKEDVLYSDEMLGHAEDYADYIQEKASAKSAVVLIEETLDFSDYVPEGFGTGDCIVVADNKLTIIDFKYGKGVEVSAEDNPQMMLYALGAMSMYDCIYQFDTIEMCIFQPRLGNISESTMSVADIEKWGREVVTPTAELAFVGMGEPKAGPHCLFCKAKGKCKQLATYALETVKNDFENEDGDLDKNLLSPHDIAMILEKAPTVKKWIATVEEDALKDVLYNGLEIPGFKVVEGRSNRAFSDQEEAFKKIIASGIDECLLYERKPLSLTNVEKLVKKKKFEELVGDLVIKPKGKPTLVPNSDKREPWQSDDFDVVTE